MTIELLVFVTLGSLWRLYDGREHPWWWNGAGLAIISWASFVGVGFNWWIVWFTVIIWAALQSGYTKWESFKWMIPRYLFPTMLAGLTYGIAIGDKSAILYGFLGLIPGLAYPILAKYGNDKLPIFWWLDGPEAYARLLAGGVLVGGLTIL